MVDVRAVETLAQPVTLKQCRTETRLKNMVLVNNSRLSVQPVTEAEWALVCRLGGKKSG
jgi:predicted RNA-binding protein with PUA-like domain